MKVAKRLALGSTLRSPFRVAAMADLSYKQTINDFDQVGKVEIEKVEEGETKLNGQY